MRRLGAALAGGEGEDLVQETWLVALAGPQRAVTHPRRWLATVMRNLARARARRDGRRERREEQREPRQAEPSTHELAARAELEQLAVQAVLALDEPWRETLLLRYVQELEPAEIAQRLGLPGSTVRSRLAHGLERVRARLDRQHGGERGAWSVVLLAGTRAPLSTTTLVAAGAAGGLLMNLKWTVAVASVALLAVLVVVQQREEGRNGRAPQENGAAVALLPAPTLEDEPVAPPVAARVPAEDPAREQVESSASTTLATLEVLLRWSDGVTPAADLPIVLERWYSAGAPLERSARSDAGGRATFTELAPGTYLVAGRSSVSDFVELEAGRTQLVELILRPGVDVDVLVLDDAETPVPGASVWLSSYGNSSYGVEVGRSDARGRLWLEDVEDGQNVAAWARGYAPSAQAEVVGAAQSELELVLRLRPGLRGLRGRVLDEAGLGLAAARVEVGAAYPGMLEFDDGSQHTGPPPRRLFTEAEGRFALDGLEPGPLEVRAYAAGHAPGRAVARDAEVELVLAPEARVAGHVRLSDGRAAAGVEIIGSNGDLGEVTTRTATDGSFRLGGLLEGARELRAVDAQLGSVRVTLALVSGTETPWEAVLSSGPSLAGHVRDERGEPLVGWQVAAVKLEHVGLWLRDTHTDTAGAFELVNCPAGAFLLAVRSPDDPWGEPALLTGEFQLGARDLELVVPTSAQPTARVTGRVLDSAGNVPAGASVVLAPGPHTGGVPVPLAADGHFRLGPTRPGPGVLTIWTRDHAPLETEVFTLRAGQELDLGTLRLEAPGYLEVQARGLDSPLPPTAIAGLTLLRAERWAGSVQFQDGLGRSGPLAPGEYVVSGHEDDWYADDARVTIEPGQTHALELVFRPAGRQELEFVVPEGDLARRFELLVRDTDGRVTHHHWTGYRPADRYTASAGGLPPGDYTFEAWTDTGRRAAGGFTLLEGSAPGAPLVLELR